MTLNGDPAPHQTRTIVTCHANADFDAFAAMLAASKLYAPCDLLFPGTQEKNLEKLFKEIQRDPHDIDNLNFLDSQSLAWERYDELIIVDTRQRSRLHHVWKLLDNPGIKVQAWDHHPDTSDDVHAYPTHISHAGAITSTLVIKLRDRGFTITPREASLLGLGIYSDTGSFAYSSTSGDDFEAAAWLLSQGMDINIIRERAAFEMTSVHVHALNSLLESVQSYRVNGIEVFLAEASLEYYLGDFAYLAHRLMEMEKFTVLFAIGRMDDRIQVVARSRSSAINVGAICSSFGGGGHVYAASASIRDMSLSQVHDGILNALYLQQSGEKTAKDYMSAPAVGIEEGHTIREADELMMHFGLKTVPIFSSGTRCFVGLLDSSTSQRAIAHGLADSPVDDYMLRGAQSLPPDATLKDITTVIVGARQRLVPIVQENLVIGVVTRTDLISIFAQEPGRMDTGSRVPKARSLSRAMEERLPQDILKVLKCAGELGHKLASPVYVVGGFVRDLLLKTPNHDIDLVIEGDGLGFASKLAQALHGRVRIHKKFLTSVVLYPNDKGEEQRIDVATARLEYYESPAALPTVEHSSIKMDLYRRDFSINALAIRLDSTHLGEIVDFFGGQRDIKDGIIRVLHTLSFVEDPTRCLRAVRFEQRYHFRLGASTEKLIRNAISLHLLDKLSPARIFNELEHIANEETVINAVLRLDELGILGALQPQLALTSEKKRILPRIGRIINWYRLLFLDEEIKPWLVLFLGLVSSSSYIDTLTAFERLGIPQPLKTYVMNGREHMRGIRPALRRIMAGPLKVSEFCKLVAPLSIEALLYLMASTNNSELRRALSRYITSWRNMTLDINGNDLSRWGLTPSPLYGIILNKLLQAKLDGEANNTEEQESLAAKLIQQAKDGLLKISSDPCRRKKKTQCP